jgi:phospholipid/cholesterol/gamma-HCH transport system substrate-binding protein
MRSVSGIGRIATVSAVVIAIVIVAVVLFGGVGSSGHQIKAVFLNASQLVSGNQVEVAGTSVGSVTGLDITPQGQAVVDMKIDDGDYWPLPRGTKAIVRVASLSGYANRYVELQLPPDRKSAPKYADGATIPAADTTAAVELDQVFDTFDPSTRKALQGFFKGSAEQFSNQEQAANAGLHYLNPALSTSSRLFNELNRDTPLLSNFLNDSARVVNALASRRDQLAGLVQNLNQTTAAVGSQRTALADAIGRLPDFMRRANTTFVNLRATLNDVNPLVDAGKPAAKALKPFLDQLQPLARDAKPTVRDLNDVIKKSGADNDLIELTRSFTPLAHIAVDSDKRNGATRRGAFPESADALTRSAPIVAFSRPYTPDLFGWFDDFSTTGGYDALGGISRAKIYFNAFSLTSGGLPGDPLKPLFDDRGQNFLKLARIKQYKRCPGASETPAPDGSNVFSAEEQKALDCTESDRATGPIK